MKSKGYMRRVIRRFSRNKLAVVGLFFLAFLMICAIFCPIITGQSPNKINEVFNARPSAEHILGTDQIGRDVFTRLIYGSRISLCVGIGTAIISITIGTVLGLIAGYFGGKIDMIIMRITDIFISFPDIMLILVVVSVVGPGLFNIITVLGLLGWPNVARIVRANVLIQKQLDYTKAAIVIGCSTTRILRRHILVNIMSPILVNATTAIASAIITESALSFLGLGVQPPTSSWGNMLTDAQSLTVLTSQPWLWIPPGIMIILSVLSINFIGEGLRDEV